MDAAAAVEAAIDTGALAAWLARKTPEEGPNAAQVKVTLRVEVTPSRRPRLNLLCFQPLSAAPCPDAPALADMVCKPSGGFRHILLVKLKNQTL